MSIGADSTSHSDVLIVGAGSAGSVLAARLSADPGCRVTVLEAGPGPGEPGVRALTGDARRLPIGAASPVARRFRTRLTDNPPRHADIVRGATVGGSGAVNGGYFCRALPADFERIRLPGWSWPEVEGHYRAVSTDLDQLAWGGYGPVRVRRIGEFGRATASFVDAARAAGYRWLTDLNAEPAGAGEPAGVAAVPLNVVDGVRWGPGAAFLEPAAARPNLTVRTGTRARRVRLAGTRATGVEAVGPDGPLVVTADRVVLSAGALGSAHLLMLSGVGPAGTLHAAGIVPVLDLPVGRRCWDHPEWVATAGWQADSGRPVLEAVLAGAGLEIRPYTAGFVAMVGDHAAGQPDWPHVGVALMNPAARGRVSIGCADPDVAPLVEHRYDSEPADIGALRDGYRLASEMLSGTTELGPPAWSTSQHLSGSAPMGADGDRDAVLDPRCRVRGLDGLWVVDGSVLPEPVSRGPHATIAMIGHRAAEFVV